MFVRCFFSLIFSLALFGLCAQTASVVEVYKIFQGKCVSCHNPTDQQGGLDLQGAGATETLRAINVAQKLVNVNPTNTAAVAQGIKRIHPGRPDRSFLFRKINAGFEPHVSPLEPGEGQSMPAYPGDPLSSVEKEIVRQWILYGARTTGVQFDKTLVETFHTAGGLQSYPQGPPPAPAPSEGFQIKMGPFYLPPSGEVEYFQKHELFLPDDVEVARIDFQFSPYSHHFLLYHFTSDNAAAAMQAGLRLNAFHNNVGLTAAVQQPTDLRLPPGTAFRWKKNLTLDLNSHYINYSPLYPYQCEVYINVYTQPAGTATQEMFATLLVNPSIPIPNNGNLITHTKSEFQPGADSIYIWGLMGHVHKYGRSYKAWRRLPNGQKGEMIYDAACQPEGQPGCVAPYFDYQHIPMRYWEPQSLPIRWSHGLIHEATWVNDGPVSVNFGPTSDDEMMLMAMLYTTKQVLLSAHDDPSLMPSPLPALSPNPVRVGAVLRIALPEAAPGLQFLRLCDATGREVWRMNTPANDRVVEAVVPAGIAPGLYFVQTDTWAAKLIVTD